MKFSFSVLDSKKEVIIDILPIVQKLFAVKSYGVKKSRNSLAHVVTTQVHFQ